MLEYPEHKIRTTGFFMYTEHITLIGAVRVWLSDPAKLTVTLPGMWIGFGTTLKDVITARSLDEPQLSQLSFTNVRSFFRRF